MDREIMKALEADGEKLRHMTGEDHGPFGVVDDVFELMEAVDNLLISKAMGWDMDGAIERLRAAKERVDANHSEKGT